MEDFGKAILTIFGGVILLAVVATVIGQKSQAPAAIHAASSGLANVVAAAVSPVHTAATNGNNGRNTFTTPGLDINGLFGDAIQNVLSDPSSVIAKF